MSFFPLRVFAALAPNAVILALLAFVICAVGLLAGEGRICGPDRVSGGDGARGSLGDGDTTMAMTVSEIKEWLDSLPPDAVVGIDEGGLILQQIAGEAYLEIGGIPENQNA